MPKGFGHMLAEILDARKSVDDLRRGPGKCRVDAGQMCRRRCTVIGGRRDIRRGLGKSIDSEWARLSILERGYCLASAAPLSYMSRWLRHLSMQMTLTFPELVPDLSGTWWCLSGFLYAADPQSN